MSAVRVPATDGRLAVRLNRGATWHRVAVDRCDDANVTTACGISEPFESFVLSTNGEYDCGHCARAEARRAKTLGVRP